MKQLLCLFLVVFSVALTYDKAGGVPDRKPLSDDSPRQFVNSIGMKFVWIPPGTFIMGSPKEEQLHVTGWETLHKVTLTRGFFMGAYLVTQEEWQAGMGGNPSHFKGEKKLPVENVS
jgi:formylglycine-generating enzyme required for sulfatase activity